MQYADKVLNCRDCGTNFTFTAGEQEFYASRGFDNAPSRCPTCRAARKAERGSGSNGSGGLGTYSGGPRRDFYTASCAQCGREARLPFQPRGDKPVYCSECFETQRGSSNRATPGGYR